MDTEFLTFELQKPDKWIVRAVHIKPDTPNHIEEVYTYRQVASTMIFP